MTLENSFPQSPFKDLTPISEKLFLINTRIWKWKIKLCWGYFVIYFISNLSHLAHFWWFELIKNTFLRDMQENWGRKNENNFDLSAVRKLNNWANRSISCGRKIRQDTFIHVIFNDSFYLNWEMRFSVYIGKVKG